MSNNEKKFSQELPFPAGAPRDLKISFEFFPPKTEKMAETLWSSIQRLEPLQPRFVSVTYGAGGSTRERTHATVVRILKETSLTPAAHLTCVNATKEEVDAVAQDYWQAGVRNIVALRGDPPDGETAYQPHPGGYDYAVDLVEGLKRIADFDISVAAYPEGHPQASTIDSDIENLKRKIDAGADRAITQYFFGAEPFLRFMDRVRNAGIEAPIVPGILPVQNFSQVVKFSDMSGTSVPAWMAELFEGLDDDPETRKLVAATAAAEQCRQLHVHGITEFHFYTLNRADLTYAIAHILGLRPENITGDGEDSVE
ncbi:MAG: methylenetetrahydrofolate reductase [NAD(P)H] [Rhodospirillaceae bacterium]|nr:methylenetetrahydrofolate reductase [NAD(P)H] [Rhodospirillaceae bacterium]|tara:strand:- start:4655 stop:5590 length:936 start_codon:yes stop_codon:yes gene_type:complete